MKNKKCKKCGNIRYLLSHSLCTKCYRINNSKNPCINCNKNTYIVAKKMCPSCYNSQCDNYSNHRFIIRKSNTEFKCRYCDENKVGILDVHHIDGNHKNNNIENLVYLCANHHREITLGYRKYI